jgi:hypothetical protein
MWALPAIAFVLATAVDSHATGFKKPDECLYEAQVTFAIVEVVGFVFAFFQRFRVWVLAVYILYLLVAAYFLMLVLILVNADFNGLLG